MTPEHTHSRSTDFQLGENSATIALILASQARMEHDITSIKDTLAQQRGERRVAVWAAGGVGSLVMLILSIIGKKLGISVP